MDALVLIGTFLGGAAAAALPCYFWVCSQVKRLQTAAVEMASIAIAGSQLQEMPDRVIEAFSRPVTRPSRLVGRTSD